MHHLTSGLRRHLARLRVVDQLVGIVVGVVAALVVATAVLAFGDSSSSTLEDAYEPVASTVE